MAKVFPEIFEENHSSEQFLYDWVKEKLPNNWIGYFNYFISTEECDIILLVPEFGILIVEIKAWKHNRIVEVVDQNKIIYQIKRKHQSYTSPYRQAKRYTRALIDKIRRECNTSYVIGEVVCYTEITKDQFDERNLSIICERDSTILKDDLNDPEEVINKIKTIITQKKQDVFNFEDFTQESVMKIRRLFEGDPQPISNSNSNIDERKKSHSLSKNELKKVEQPYQGNQHKKNNDSTYAKVKVLKQNPTRNIRKYSILCYIPNHLPEKIKEEKITKLLESWSKGTKIMFVTNGELNSFQSKLYEAVCSKKLDGFVAFNILDKKRRVSKSLSITFHFTQ